MHIKNQSFFEEIHPIESGQFYRAGIALILLPCSLLLSRLYNCGFIVMRDSGNFKHGILNHSADTVTACGIDLSILIVRYHELKKKTDVLQEAYNKQKEALKCFQGLVRQIKTSYALIEAMPFVSMLFSKAQKIMHIIDTGRPKLQLKNYKKPYTFLSGFCNEVLRRKH